MPRDDDLIHLLLANAGDRTPALPDGLPLAAAAPDPTPRAPSDVEAGDVPDDVPIDMAPPPPPRWGIVAPEGPAGDRLLALVAPLIRRREAQQGAPAPIHRVPKPERPWTTADALRWRADHYDSGAGLGRDRAVHQLILGDLDAVPLALQQLQAIDGQVGRLAFDDDAGYEAYVEKVLRAERAAGRGPGRLLLHTAHDGSPALDVGSTWLAAPGEAALRSEIAQRGLAASEVLTYAAPGMPGLDVLLDRAAGPQPGALFTLGHGLGAPRAGWGSPAEQRADQGAMAFGIEGQIGGRDVARQPFMPDGLWLMFACFGAGTPDASAYARWLDRMAAFGRRAPDVRRSLALGAPFIADLPRRALASPRGPLAFVGHVDLAWTFSFRDEEDPERSRAGRFMRVLAAALSGATMGTAFQELARFVAEKDAELTTSYATDAGADDGGARPLELRRALLWMARQDLAGFILLGDPWARLPVGAPAAAAPPTDDTPPSVASVASDEDGGGAAPVTDALERAIGAIIAGRSVEEVAAERGIAPEALARATALYREAGRRALGGAVRRR